MIKGGLCNSYVIFMSNTANSLHIYFQDDDLFLFREEILSGRFHRTDACESLPLTTKSSVKNVYPYLSRNALNTQTSCCGLFMF